MGRPQPGQVGIGPPHHLLCTEVDGIMVAEIALHVHPGVDKRDMGYTVVPIGPYEQGG